MNHNQIPVSFYLHRDGVRVTQDFTFSSFIPGIPNMPHRHHYNGDFELGASAEEFQNPCSGGDERATPEMDLKFRFDLGPYLLSKLAEQQNMLDRLVLITEDAGGPSWNLPLL